MSANAYAVDRPDGDQTCKISYVQCCFSSLPFAYQEMIQTHLHICFCLFSHSHDIYRRNQAIGSKELYVAAVTEDADAITEMHDAVLGKKLFAVDAPDGEHDYEDVVSCFDSLLHL